MFKFKIVSIKFMRFVTINLILAYFISSLQTFLIIKTIRKSKGD